MNENKLMLIQELADNALDDIANTLVDETIIDKSSKLQETLISLIVGTLTPSIIYELGHIHNKELFSKSEYTAEELDYLYDSCLRIAYLIITMTNDYAYGLAVSGTLFALVTGVEPTERDIEKIVDRLDATREAILNVKNNPNIGQSNDVIKRIVGDTSGVTSSSIDVVIAKILARLTKVILEKVSPPQVKIRSSFPKTDIMNFGNETIN